MADLGIIDTDDLTAGSSGYSVTGYMFFDSTSMVWRVIDTDDSISDMRRCWFDIYPVIIGDIISGSGAITVTIKILGAVAENIPCNLYDRVTHRILGKDVSDQNGIITFSGFNTARDDFYVAAFSAQDYNAVIYDKLTPV